MAMNGINGVNPLNTPKDGLKKLEGGITEGNNSYGIFKDKNGNSIYRVDYRNNDKNGIYDEEEVRTPEGKLVSYTERSYSRANDKVENMYFKKYHYDTNGDLTKITETTCDANGEYISTKELPIEEEPVMTGQAHLGTPVDGDWGDKDLLTKLRNWGAQIIGNG